MTWCCFSPPLAKDTASSRELDGFSPGKNIKLFTYKELMHATNNFDQRNRIGQGGFGKVFRGTLRNGIQIAVKVLCTSSKQGDSQFLAELNSLANIKHPNLVELLGCCMQRNNRILVYEFVENGSIDRTLLGPDRESNFDWSTRSAICIGTARGLTFLHEEALPQIVHRDIKASNILLDGKFAPKIGDFGLAKLFPDNITHLSTRVAGTTGYLAPEYAIGGRLTKKADVYSFGVLILEIISGRSISKMIYPGREKFLLEQAWQLHEEKRLTELVDPVLKDYPEEEALKFIKVALFCVQGAAGRRPSMPQVLEMLSNRVRLNEKELTPPGLIDDKPANEDSNGGNSCVTRMEIASTVISNASITFSEISPR